MSRLFALFVSLFILAMSGMSLFFSYGIFKALWTQDYFNILPHFMRQTKDIDDLRVFPIESGLMSDAQQREITRELIEDYITYRYTIYPNQNLMARNLGLWWVKGQKDQTAENASYVLWTTDEKSDVWKKLVDEAGGHQAQAMKLIEEGKTQSVEIMNPPYQAKESDFWETYIKLYVYNPDDTVDIRFLTVRMHVELGTSLRGRQYINLYPATLFRFQVKQLHEVFAGHRN